MKTWYRITMAADDATVADIRIDGIIGDWIDDMFGFGDVVTAKSFVGDLAKLPDSVKTIRVRINSPGGSVFDATSIANALRDQRMTKGRKVETFVEGIAASAASIIMMAGDPVQVADNAIVMIHNPWTRSMGESKDLRKDAEVLDEIRNTIVATYRWHTELSDDEVVALMDAETWMSAEEAVEKGFASEVVEGLKAAACVDRRFAAKLNVPDRFKARVDELLEPAAAATPAPEPVKETPKPKAAAPAEVVKLCREAECFDLAEGFITSGAPIETVTADVAKAKAARATAKARADEITALCATARLPELAEGYVSSDMPVDQVRKHLTTISAAADKAEIDASLLPATGDSVEASWKKSFARVGSQTRGK